ncbi:MAG: hypothetical protein GX325_08765 [Peptococcaceae bacterium]|nr:hypothetical protein [Peptococcaceae bacterium]
MNCEVGWWLSPEELGRGNGDTALSGAGLWRWVMSPNIKSAGLTKASDIEPSFKERLNPRISDGTV